MNRALYCLAHKSANFQFLNWAVMAKAQGAKRVVFNDRCPKTTKWPLEEVRRRIDSILVPCARLVGLKVEWGTDGEDLGGQSHFVETFVSWVRAGGQFERLRSVLPHGTERYTVTLRRTARAADRNSNERDWRTFAAEIGARVIEDWDVEPLDLLERVALYAGAEMNFFVTNGPMHLCSMTHYPMMVFACDKAEGAFGRIGVRRGEQLPWTENNQRLIWEPDELPVLRRHFAAWRG